MSVCAHNPHCPGFGWAHDANLTPAIRSDLGLPERGEVSMAHAKRLMRSYRKGWGDACKAVENLTIDQIVSVQEQEESDGVQQPTEGHAEGEGVPADLQAE